MKFGTRDSIYLDLIQKQNNMISFGNAGDRNESCMIDWHTPVF